MAFLGKPSFRDEKRSSARRYPECRFLHTIYLYDVERLKSTSPVASRLSSPSMRPDLVRTKELAFARR